MCNYLLSVLSCIYLYLFYCNVKIKPSRLSLLLASLRALTYFCSEKDGSGAVLVIKLMIRIVNSVCRSKRIVKLVRSIRML
jgi:hypothetical protein